MSKEEWMITAPSLMLGREKGESRQVHMVHAETEVAQSLGSDTSDLPDVAAVEPTVHKVC